LLYGNPLARLYQTCAAVSTTTESHSVTVVGPHRFWHPFSNMGAVRDAEVVFVRGEGCYLWDAGGKRYLDASAGLWYCNVGNGREEIADAVRDQIARLAASSCYDVYTTDTTLALADRVAALAPLDDATVFFTSGGSDSIDTAAKVAQRYWAELGRPDKTIVVSRERAYHGMHAFGTSIGGIPANREKFGPLVEAVATVPAMDPDALAAKLDELGPERVAAFFAEPVIGAGGIFPPPDDYLARAQAVCAERDVLFVVDEVITGFGRLGKLFGSQVYGVRPDMMICAKGLTSGYAPLGAVVFSGRVAEPFWQRGGTTLLRTGYTYSGHAAACAAGMANLDILERESLVDRVAGLMPEFHATMRELAELPEVSEVRTAGLLAAVQISDEPRADAGYAGRLLQACRDAGLVTRMLVGDALQISPSFVLTGEQAREIRDLVEQAIVASR
jgi:putrescine---pyruvate transaminase